MNRTTRKSKASPKKADMAKQREADDEKLKVETLAEEKLFKALPRDLQWEILSEYLGTHVVRNGKLMRRMTGAIQSRLLDSMPQMMLGRRPQQLNLKSVPMQLRNRNEWFKSFDTPRMQGVLGFRTLSVVEDHNGNPSYEYTSHIDGQDPVEISTPIVNSTALEPYVRHNYPSYPFTDRKLGRTTLKSRKPVLFNPTKPNTGYRPRPNA